jgi:hypothetical protein
LAAHAVDLLGGLGVSWKTLQLMAPALSIAAFKTDLLPAIDGGRCPPPTLYLLSKDGELADTVGPYKKSLLYLVSNAFEDERGTPLLGMAKFLEAQPALMKRLQGPVDGRPGVVISGAPGTTAQSDTHGGFDNDPSTMNSVLTRILGAVPAVPFTARDLQF